ncbi:LacI family DNA-binding transcriptional regulator [Phaeobacter sp. J2-8]|uniref:LacI family DNA-binding transcriptional regulator n=1 Tax=Phaeobacter sp. J2-8 TaxID=2931394 RepID=UPI001FD36420|nr:LacI family DNA-binding transcriptional regulator [Phaeobacter sp. J2-8]MCJ7874531.1 LacI family transcriptional regulator [Phaeobacter sp. J2-8]
MAGIKDVAKKAGVSVSTVSNVINGRHAKMGARTLRRVQEAIAELNYTPSAVARQLKSGHIKTLGLVVPSVANPFWGNVSQLIEKAALKRGYQVLICNAERDPELEANYMTSLQGSLIRGTILGSSPVSFDHLREHSEKGMHIGAFDRASRGAEGIVSCSVSVDQDLGARLATRHLIGLGHKKIAFISGPIGTSSRIARLEGVQRELSKVGLSIDEDLIWLGPQAAGFGDSQAAELGRTAARELLTRDDPPTAIFAVNDMYAIGACSGARELGYRVPDDLSVVGFDDIIMAKVMEPPLTTVRQPVEQMAELMVARLIETLEDEDGPAEPHVILRPELIVRSSTAARKNSDSINSGTEK